MGNPDDKIMQANIKYYLTRPNINQDMLEDMEEKLFVKLYLDGIDAYENENWDTCIENMEESLMQFIRNEDECRAFCEGEFDHGWYPDLISSIGSMYNHFYSHFHILNNFKLLSLIKRSNYIFSLR